MMGTSMALLASGTGPIQGLVDSNKTNLRGLRDGLLDWNGKTLRVVVYWLRNGEEEKKSGIGSRSLNSGL